MLSPPDNPRGEHLHITSFHHIGNMSGDGIPDLMEAIAREAQHVAGMGEPWKPQWRRAEQALLTLGEDTHAIPEAQFLEICQQNGVSNQEVCSFLSGYWHRLGKITYFPDDPHLKDAVVP